MVEHIENTITFYSHRVRARSTEEIADEVLKEIEKRGMVPVSQRVGFSGTATVRKWEEDITENDWDRAFDRMERD